MGGKESQIVRTRMPVPLQKTKQYMKLNYTITFQQLKDLVGVIA